VLFTTSSGLQASGATNSLGLDTARGTRLHARAAPVQPVVKGSVFVRRGMWVASRAWIRNPSRGWWAPRARVRFTVRNRAGVVVSTYVAGAVLPPNRTVSVVAPAFLLPPSSDRLSSVSIRVRGGTWKRRTSYVPRLRLAHIRTHRGNHRVVVGGVIWNRSALRLAAIVGCAASDRDRQITGGAVARVIARPKARTRFRTLALHAATGTRGARCRVMRWDLAPSSAP
jgi:hypothetical protein